MAGLRLRVTDIDDLVGFLEMTRSQRALIMATFAGMKRMKLEVERHFPRRTMMNVRVVGFGGYKSKDFCEATIDLCSSNTRVVGVELRADGRYSLFVTSDFGCVELVRLLLRPCADLLDTLARTLNEEA